MRTLTSRLRSNRALRPFIALTLLASLLSGATLAVTGSPAAAAPNLDVSVTAPDEVLVGEGGTISVTANNSTATPGYNTGIVVVLPAGVSYTPGSSTAGTPTIESGPGAGETTLYFVNVNDSQPSAPITIEFDVTTNGSTLPVGADFAVSATAYTSDDPRVVPLPDSFALNPNTGSGTGSSSTEVTAILLEKSEPSPEDELMRGVHDHATVYTLTVENNPANATNSITVEDWLPAGLEFLGCGTVDNTTDAPTFTGNNVEYSGAPRLDVSTADITADCPAPTTVETITVDPDGAGPLPSAVYTHVVWDIGNLTPGQTFTIQYAAGIPIRENTETWSGATPDTTGGQIANLDNNSGPETTDEQLLRNYALASGSYTGPFASGAANPVTSDAYEQVIAEDIRIIKSVDNADITQLAAATWTLTISTSEYRTATNVDVTDTLPDGQCPMGPVNYENAADQQAECDPNGMNPSQPYTSVTENADGSYTIFWDDAVSLGASDTHVITFPSKVRESYQENFLSDAPVVTADGFTNTVSMTADDLLIAGIPADEADGQPDPDTSSASQTAGNPSISKTVAVPAAPGATLDCATATYVEADQVADAPFSYRPGDQVCFDLEFIVPANLTLRNAVASDFLPDTLQLVSATTNPGNDVTDIAGPFNLSDGSAAGAGSTEFYWEIGTTVIDGARYLPISTSDRTFSVRILADVVASPDTSAASLDQANLWKLTTQNTAGTAVSLRDQSNFQVIAPELTLAKATPTSQFVAGDTIDYTLTIANITDAGTNAGYGRVENIDLTDALPSPFTCADITAGPSDSGTCSGDVITWPDFALDAGASTTRTYTITAPTTVSAGRSYVNTADIGDYTYPTNDGGTVTTTGPTAQETVTTPGATITKVQQSAVGESGNSQLGTPGTGVEEATIGEQIVYTTTVTVPAGVTVFDAAFRDDLPAGLAVVSGTITASVANDLGTFAVPANGFVFDSGNPLEVEFPATYTNPAGSGDDTVTITFTAVVEDIGGNTANTLLRNNGQFVFKATASGSNITQNGANVDVRIVEPNPQIAKDENDADDIVAPGQTLDYTLTITNPDHSSNRGSVAHDLVVVDTIPDRFTPVLPIPNGGVWDVGGRTITWDGTTTPSLLSLDVGGSTSLTYQVTVNDPVTLGGSITNSVTVTATSMAGTPTGERTTYSATTTDTVTTPAATITKALDPDTGPYTIGETVTYQVDVTLPQDGRVFDLTATDVVPDGLVFDATTAITPSAECSITGDTGLTFTTANADGSTTVDFFLGDVVAVGGDCTVTIDYSTHVDSTYNGTGTPADGVVVDAGDALTNSADLGWMLTDTVTTTPSSSGDLPGAFDDTDGPVTTSITIAEPQLAIDKDVDLGAGALAGCDDTHAATGGATDDDACDIELGDGPFTYTLTIQNTGTEPAHDIVITDQPGPELINVTPVTGAASISDAWTLADPAMAWSFAGPLAVGDSITVTYTAELDVSANLSASDSVDNSADVPTYFGLDSTDRATSTNERTYGGTNGAVTADVVQLDLDVPVVAIAKTVADGSELDEAVIGQAFEWHIEVSNTAPRAGLFDVDVTDTLPVNWSYVASSAQLCTPTCVALADPTITGTAATGFQLDWTDVADLAAGATFEIRFDTTPGAAVTTAPGVGGTVDHTNTASAVGDDATGATGSADGPYASGDDTADARIYEADLRLDKAIITPDPGPYIQGQTVDYRITVTNDGPDAAINTVVDEILDGGDLIYVSTVSADGSYDSGSGEWTLPTPLANGASAELVVRVILDHAGSITNRAEVVATDRYDPDSTPGNGGDEDDDDSVTITVASLASLDATLTKVLDPDTGPYTIGETVTFQVDVTLPEDGRVYDMTVIDTVPDGLEFDSTTSMVGSSACTITGDTGLTFTTANADGSTDVAFFLGDVAASGGDCTVTIDYVTHVGATYDGTGLPADGTAVAAGESLVNSAELGWMLVDTVTTTPTGAGDLPGTFAYTNGPVTTSITIAEPQLAIDKDVDLGAGALAGCDDTHAATGGATDDDACDIELGDGPFTYTLTIQNTGTEPAHDIVITDQPGPELINVTPVTGAASISDAWTLADPAMAWSFAGPLAVGDSITVTYTAELDVSANLSASDSVDNSADVPTYFGLDSTDRATSTNERTYGGTNGAVTADVVQLDLDVPVVAIAKTVADGSELDEAVIGQAFEWHIEVSNTAPRAGLFDVDVTDTLPVNWSYVASSAQLCTPTCVALADPTITGTAATGFQLDWTDVADLAAGATFEIRFDTTPGAAVTTAPGVGGTVDHTNTASAVGDDATGATGSADGPYASGDDTADARIYEADLRLDKAIITPDPGPYIQGQTVDYRITVTNDGPDAAINTVVDEILDGGDLIYVSTVSADGSYDSGSGEWTLPTPLANGASAELVVRVILDHAGSITNRAEVVATDRYDPDSTPGNGGDEDDDDSVTITVSTASLGSTVWYDVDASGGDETTKGLEPGIPGVTVNLLSAGNDGIIGTADDYFGPDGVAGGGDDITVTAQVTDASGNYAFGDLPVGTYRVEIDPTTLPGGSAGWDQTFDDNGVGTAHISGDIVLTPTTTSYVDADFSYSGAGELGDELFWDVDRSNDGVFAGQDQELQDVDVDLAWAGFDGVFGTADDVTFPTQTTTTTGFYLFEDLPPGDYRTTVDTTDPDFPLGLVDQTWDVEHTAPGGADGEPDPTAEVTLGAGESKRDVDFSFAGTASLGDQLWLDLDGDGTPFDAETGTLEPGLPGVTITLVWHGPDGAPGGDDDRTLTTETAADGTYSFDNLPAGQFEVTVDTADPDFPAGVVPTHDLDGGDDHTSTVSLATGTDRTDVDFGYRGVGSIGDLVWLDLDGDQTVDDGTGGTPAEPGIPGVELIVEWAGVDGVFGTADDVLVRTETDADGVWSVPNLPYGDYRTTVDPASLPADLVATYDLDGGLDSTADATLDAATPDRDDVDFGYRGSAEIGDTVWIDLDADGVLDTGNPDPADDEVGIDGIDVQITLAGGDGVLGTDDDIVVTTTTSGGGIYGVDGLPAGPVRVDLIEATVPADHVLTYDPDSGAIAGDPDLVVDGTWLGIIGTGETNLDVDFGLRPDADLSITKSHTGEFVVGSEALYVLEVANAGPATATAVQVVDELPAGLTFVSATGPATCVAVDQTVTCDLASLDASASFTIDLLVAVGAEAAPGVTNTAAVSTETADRDPRNNSDDDPTEVPLAELTLDKQLVGDLTAGENATYRFVITNTGPSAATDVVLDDPLPTGLSYVSAEGDGWTCSATTNTDGETVGCVLDGDLAADSSTTVSITARVATSARGSIENLATIGSSTFQTTLTDDSDAVAGTVAVPSDLLAFTGSSTQRAMWMALILMIGGLGLIGLARRRRPTEVDA